MSNSPSMRRHEVYSINATSPDVLRDSARTIMDELNLTAEWSTTMNPDTGYRDLRFSPLPLADALKDFYSVRAYMPMSNVPELNDPHTVALIDINEVYTDTVSHDYAEKYYTLKVNPAAHTQHVYRALALMLYILHCTSWFTERHNHPKVIRHDTVSRKKGKENIYSSYYSQLLIPDNVIYAIADYVDSPDWVFRNYSEKYQCIDDWAEQLQVTRDMLTERYATHAREHNLAVTSLRVGG